MSSLAQPARQLPPPDASSAPAPADSPGSPYSALTISAALGDMRSINLRTVLLEIAAKDPRKLTAELVAGLKDAGLVHVMPQAEWSSARKAAQEAFSSAIAESQAASKREEAARIELVRLTSRRDGFLRQVLRYFGFAKKLLEREGLEIISASRESSEAGLAAKEQSAATNLRTARINYLETFTETPSGMVSLTSTGKQLTDDLRDEIESTFGAFAANLAAKVKPSDPAIRPHRPRLFHFGNLNPPRRLRPRMTIGFA